MYFSLPLAWAIAFAFITASNAFRNVLYIDEWHPDIPTDHNVTTGITHVTMAFVDPINFTTTDHYPPPPLMSVQDLRSHFDNDTKVGIAVGGWGPFSTNFGVVSTKEYRANFSTNLAEWMDQQGYDYVDIDWEYPGGNGAQQPTNATAEIENFPLLLEAIKGKLKPERGISLALAGVPDGMKAFSSPEQSKIIWDNINFITVMAYDFVNRASHMTGHHTDVESCKTAVQRYIDLGLPAEKINLGFAFYAKYFQVDEACSNFTVPDGCSIVSAQDADGTDTFTSGVLTYQVRNMERPPIPANLQLSPDATCGYYNNTLTGYKCSESYCCAESGWCGDERAHCVPNCQVGFGRCDGPDAIASFQKARESSNYDQQKGALWYFDETTSPKLFWSWENTTLMSRKFDEIVNNPANLLGGVSGWSLGENSAGWGHVQQMRNMTQLRNSGGQDQECPPLP
ncbi:glycoside hydrolase superfamily [Xylaria venustula]|nr:glycoside hydrolase superfamily [Xylaria venustula]